MDNLKEIFIVTWTTVLSFNSTYNLTDPTHTSMPVVIAYTLDIKPMTYDTVHQELITADTAKVNEVLRLFKDAKVDTFYLHKK